METDDCTFDVYSDQTCQKGVKGCDVDHKKGSDTRRVIELSKGYITVISQEDYRRVSQHHWYTHMSKGDGRKAGRPYARATIRGKKVYLHRFLMSPKKGMEVDHLNRQTLDNRRENLEIVTPVENQKRRKLHHGSKL